MAFGGVADAVKLRFDLTVKHAVWKFHLYVSGPKDDQKVLLGKKTHSYKVLSVLKKDKTASNRCKSQCADGSIFLNEVESDASHCQISRD